MGPYAKSFLTRVRAGLSAAKDLSGLADWLVQNTRHPKDSNRPWSYNEHEFQIGILSDSANDLVVKKCAQVGLSEISVRMALGLVDIYQHATAIYTLPTATDASLFAKSRFDAVIENSPDLRAKVRKDTDNTSLKKIGDSFLYIRGTFTQKAAISIPADILIHDEVDFSDPKTLTSYTSRLGHVKEDQIIKRRFSTPTVSGYGVSELFDDSTQCWRAVLCDHCGTWQVPKFLDDVIIPGYDAPIVRFEREDLDDPRFDISKAYVSCPGCRSPLSTANLADPDKREWVPAHPGRLRAGYQVQSFDVPAINTVPRTLRHIRDYDRKSDWVNFSVGQEYQDAETSFVSAAVKNAHCLPWIQPHVNAATGTVIGIDVGKTSWLLVGKPLPHSSMDVLHYERIKLLSQDALPELAADLFKFYGANMLVIDAGPEWTQALSVIDVLPPNKAFACYYATPTKPTMSFITDVDEENHVVRADRTAVISDVAKRVNSGRIRFCQCPEQPTMEAHLDALKRVRRPNPKGVDQDVWINAGGKPDHYGHALFFATVASNLLSYQPKVDVVPSLPLPARVKIGWQKESDHRVSYLDRR